MRVLLGIASDSGLPLWKKIAFLVFVLIATFVLYFRRSRPQHQSLISVAVSSHCSSVYLGDLCAPVVVDTNRRSGSGRMTGNSSL